MLIHNVLWTHIEYIEYIWVLFSDCYDSYFVINKKCVWMFPMCFIYVFHNIWSCKCKWKKMYIKIFFYFSRHMVVHWRDVIKIERHIQITNRVRFEMILLNAISSRYCMWMSSTEFSYEIRRFLYRFISHSKAIEIFESQCQKRKRIYKYDIKYDIVFFYLHFPSSITERVSFNHSALRSSKLDS